jgi:hypothetical protein
MKHVALILAVLMLPLLAEARKPVPLTAEQIALSVDRAVNGVPALRSAMLDPASFVLANVTLKAPNKEGVIDVCYTFRSHNRMGGYGGSGTARLNSKNIVDNISDGDMADSPFNPCFLTLQAATLSIIPQVEAALNAPPPAAPTPVLTPVNRQAFVKAFDDGQRKQGVAAYADFTGGVLTIHSERCSALRFHVLLADEQMITELKQMGFTTFIYTNDADQKFTYDLLTGTAGIVSGATPAAKQ